MREGLWAAASGYEPSPNVSGFFIAKTWARNPEK
jgi:hypothetical protein